IASPGSPDFTYGESGSFTLQTQAGSTDFGAGQAAVAANSGLPPVGADRIPPAITANALQFIVSTLGATPPLGGAATGNAQAQQRDARANLASAAVQRAAQTSGQSPTPPAGLAPLTLPPLLAR